MKTKKFLTLICIMLAVVGLLVSCDLINDFIQGRIIELPLIKTYNSELENTRRMMPNETLYVEIQHLNPNALYSVKILVPGISNPVSEIIIESDENGTINPSALWYDIGFKIDSNGRMMLPEVTDTTKPNLRSFDIQVESLEDESTNYKLPFFLVFFDNNLDRMKPIVIAGKKIGDEFSMENAFYSVDADAGLYNKDLDGFGEYTDELYVHVEHMSSLDDVMTPFDEKGDDSVVRFWILEFKGEPFYDRQDLKNDALFYNDFKVKDLKDGAVQIKWPADDKLLPDFVIGDAVHDEIPKWAEGMAFSVFLDMRYQGTEGIYHVKHPGYASYYLDSIDGNGVAGFIVREKPIPLPEEKYISMNLASGGMFYSSPSWEYYGGIYDYRDVFKAHGMDTKYSAYSGAFWGYGVKVIWNPYLVPSGWNAVGGDMPAGFWGSVADVYIVTSDQPLTSGSVIGGNDTLAVPKRRVPVQYGCGNGWWMQTIWRAPMTPGDYMIIVDMDKDGKISENDLVDNVKWNYKDGDVVGIDNDGENIGFRVIE